MRLRVDRRRTPYTHVAHRMMWQCSLKKARQMAVLLGRGRRPELQVRRQLGRGKHWRNCSVMRVLQLLRLLLRCLLLGLCGSWSWLGLRLLWMGGAMPCLLPMLLLLLLLLLSLFKPYKVSWE